MYFDQVHPLIPYIQFLPAPAFPSRCICLELPVCAWVWDYPLEHGEPLGGCILSLSQQPSVPRSSSAGWDSICSSPICAGDFDWLGPGVVRCYEFMYAALSCSANTALLQTSISSGSAIHPWLLPRRPLSLERGAVHTDWLEVSALWKNASLGGLANALVYGHRDNLSSVLLFSRMAALDSSIGPMTAILGFYPS